MTKVRTTIVLSEEDVRLIKMLAATYNLTMSEVVQKSIRQVEDLHGRNQSSKKKEAGWKTVIGSLNLGGKEPLTRRQVYDRYLKEKLSR